MCEIFFAMGIDSKERCIPDKILEKIFDEAMLSSTINRDGWGIFNENRIVMRSPKQFKAHNKYNAMKMFRGSKFIVMHLRAATQGSVCDRNTHPFRIGNSFFVHNGIARFDEKVSIDWEKEKDKTDSEKMLEVIIASSKKDFAEKIKDGIKLISGSFSSFLYGEDDILYYFREGSRFSLALDLDNNLMLGATDGQALRRMYEKVVFGVSIHPDNVHFFAPDEKWLYSIRPTHGLVNEGRFESGLNGRSISYCAPTGAGVYGGGAMGKTWYPAMGGHHNGEYYEKGYGGGKWKGWDERKKSATESLTNDDYDGYNDSDNLVVNVPIVKKHIGKKSLPMPSDVTFEIDEKKDMDWSFSLKYDNALYIIHWGDWINKLEGSERVFILEKLYEIADEREIVYGTELNDVYCDEHGYEYGDFEYSNEGDATKPGEEIIMLTACPQCVGEFIYDWVKYNLVSQRNKRNEKIKTEEPITPAETQESELHKHDVNCLCGPCRARKLEEMKALPAVSPPTPPNPNPNPPEFYTGE